MGFVFTAVFAVVSFGGLCIFDIIGMQSEITTKLGVHLNNLDGYLEQEGMKTYLNKTFIAE